jgi:hypothetical protein
VHISFHNSNTVSPGRLLAVVQSSKLVLVPLGALAIPGSYTRRNHHNDINSDPAESDKLRKTLTISRFDLGTERSRCR